MTTPAPKEQGFALLVVIMVLLLVTALAAEMTFTVRTGTQEARLARDNGTSLGLAKAGLNLGLFYLSDTPIDLNGDVPYVPGALVTTSFNSGLSQFQTISEAGKININHFKRPLLSQFLDQFDYEPEEKEIFIDSLLDWQDTDNLHRLNGAEQEYYAELNPPYQPANGPFTDPAEIALVRGAEKLIAAINPSDFFTIYNPKGQLNFNVLTHQMLGVLTDHNQEDIDHYYELKQQRPLLSAKEGQLILGEHYSLWRPYLVYSKNKNQYYTIVATGLAGAKLPNDEDIPATHFGSQLRLTLATSGNRFRYLRWSEEHIMESTLPR